MSLIDISIVLPAKSFAVANAGWIPYGLENDSELNPKLALVGFLRNEGVTFGFCEEGVIGVFEGFMVIRPVEGEYVKRDSRFRESLTD